MLPLVLCMQLPMLLAMPIFNQKNIIVTYTRRVENGKCLSNPYDHSINTVEFTTTLESSVAPSPLAPKERTLKVVYEIVDGEVGVGQ